MESGCCACISAEEEKEREEEEEREEKEENSTMSKMTSLLVGIFCLVTTCLLQQGSCLEIQSLKLVGGRGEYIDLGSGLRYTLSCSYRSGYDDRVLRVTWLLYGSRVYEWTTSTNDIAASGVLLGRVDTTPDDEPGSLHFTKLDYMVAGNYTCQVSSSSQTVQQAYYLHVVDVSPIPYDTSVHILKDMTNPEEENKYVTYDVDSAPAAISHAVEFEDPYCTLVWNFQSPAIFPKPNVTCGYYSFNHDDVIHHLPAGLTMHKFLNGSWQASFDGTRVQVSNIPMNHRLGCSVKIPDTSYREMIMSEDDFTVDALIDSVGCPGLEELPAMKGLLVEPRDSTTTCRGHLLPNNREAPAVVKLSCPNDHDAIFSDGTAEPGWWTELSCYEYDQLWRSYHVGDQQGELMDLNELPVCDRGSGASHGLKGSLLLISVALLFFLHNHH